MQLFLFFFKQKTAYEMRISDWSSDVCSSDLDVEDKGRQIELVIDRDAASRLGVDMSLISSTLNDSFSQRQVSVIYGALNQYHVVMGLDQIGRASCRERGWSVRVDTGVRRTIKKKNNHIHTTNKLRHI